MSCHRGFDSMCGSSFLMARGSSRGRGLAGGVLGSQVAIRDAHDAFGLCGCARRSRPAVRPRRSRQEAWHRPPRPESPSSGCSRISQDAQVFPGDNWWNADVSSAPVDPQSDAYIRSLGGLAPLHPDFGRSPYGLPYVTVGASQPRVPIGLLRYAAESDNGFPGDAAGYPIPEEAKTLPTTSRAACPAEVRAATATC